MQEFLRLPVATNEASTQGKPLVNTGWVRYKYYLSPIVV